MKFKLCFVEISVRDTTIVIISCGGNICIYHMYQYQYYVRGRAAAGAGCRHTPPQPAPSSSHGVALTTAGLLDARAGVLRSRMVGSLSATV